MVPALAAARRYADNAGSARRPPCTPRMLRTTPFHARTAALCASHAWRRWAGYIVASAYELSHEREYHAIRSAAALFDITPLYKYRIRGRDAARLLDRVAPRAVSRAQVGQVLYTPWCDDNGKVVDDGTIARLADPEFRMTAAEPNLNWLEQNARRLEVAIDDVSESTAALALQGPASRAILERIADGEVRALPYFGIAPAQVSGALVEISRTGYTGDLGFELWLRAEDALAVWDALMSAGADYGITPAGMLALDIARIEAGLMLIDVDYVPARKALIESPTSTPFALDLAWSVDLRKPNFVGRSALAAQAARGAERQFVGIEVEWASLEHLYAAVGLAPQLPHAAWRASVTLYASGRQVGYATSGTWSPRLKKYIALAHVGTRWASAGTALEMDVTVEHRRRRAAARVVKKPF